MRKLTALLISMEFFCAAFGNTFIVTSNADNGPGSLREAITLANANGIAVTDYIHFNIPSTTQEGRTIILLSELPLSALILLLMEVRNPDRPLMPVTPK